MRILLFVLFIGGCWGVQNAYAKTDQMTKQESVSDKKESSEEYLKRALPEIIRKRGYSCSKVTKYIAAQSNKVFALCKGGYVYRITLRGGRAYVTAE